MSAIRTPARFATYREDGGEFIVRVLWEGVWERDGGQFHAFRLRCVRQLRPSPRCGPIPEGDEWDAEERVGYEGQAGWTLTDRTEENAGPVHVCLWSSQPDILIACDHSWTTPKWADASTKTEEVYWTADARLYTFDENRTTCDACLATLADPEKRQKAGTP